MKKLLLLTPILVFLISCEPQDSANCHYTIKVKNNTDKVLFWYSASKPEIIPGDIRTDPYFAPIKAFAGNNNIEIGKIRFLGGGKPSCVESLFDTNEEETMYLFLFDSLQISKKDWSEVVRDTLIIKRLDLKLKELKGNNFTIEFNGK